MPAAAAIVDRLVDLAVGLARADAHHREFGMLGMARLLHAMRLQPAEAARVGEKFLDGERLAADDQHDAVEPGAVERVPVGVGQAANVEAGGDGADGGVGPFDLHGQSLRRSRRW
jgi:hypothetical protein